MKRIILQFGLLASAFVLLLQLTKFSWVTYGVRNEIVISIFALVFLVSGILLSRYIFRTNISSSGDGFEINEKMLDKLSISKREYEVLIAMAKGFSNREIAESLYISESTVKSHVSNILDKLHSKRRTQAIRKAKEYRLIA